LDGDLPLDAKARKAAKPDFECLMALPAFGGHTGGAYPNGALLAIGSGSRESRTRAVLLGLLSSGELSGHKQVIDFSPLFDAMRQRIDELGGKHPNVEGAVIWRDYFCLLHRGNKSGANVLIRMPLVPVLAALDAKQSPELPTDALIQTVDLGHIDGVMLGWTDADVLNDQLIVCSAAESTDNAIDDGDCMGSAIAALDWDGRVIWKYVLADSLEGTHKVEGIAATLRDSVVNLDLVTDNDDPVSPAWHLRVQLPV
jgi:hypothetical protein